MSYYDDEEVAQRQIVCFVVGLLVGGMLVWAVSGPSDTYIPPDTENTHNKKAFDACLSAGGIPINDRYNKLENCQFKPWVLSIYSSALFYVYQPTYGAHITNDANGSTLTVNFKIMSRTKPAYPSEFFTDETLEKTYRFIESLNKNEIKLYRKAYQREINNSHDDNVVPETTVELRRCFLYLTSQY